MREDCSNTRSRWSSIANDVLMKILMVLSVGDLLSVSHVCSSWRSACRDPCLWNKLDLSKLSIPYALTDFHSSQRLTQVLSHALGLSNGKISCLVFHYSIRIKDVHFVFAAQRTRNLKQLVLPAWSHLSRTGVHRAIRMWKGLESLTIPSMTRPYQLLIAIGKHCKNFSELKITCNFDLGLACALIRHIPKLKILSVHCSTVNKQALDRALRCLEHLEELNTTHSLVTEIRDARRNIVVYKPTELPTILDVSRLKRLINCQGDKCYMCMHMFPSTLQEPHD